MLGPLRHARLSALALALYALATLLVGFAHKPIPQVSAPQELIALALHGDVPVALCDRTGAPAQQAVDHLCDACALTSAPGLPPAELSAQRARHALQPALAFNDAAQFAPAAVHAPLSRGPPAA